MSSHLTVLCGYHCSASCITHTFLLFSSIGTATSIQILSTYSCMSACMIFNSNLEQHGGVGALCLGVESGGGREGGGGLGPPF